MRTVLKHWQRFNRSMYYVFFKHANQTRTLIVMFFFSYSDKTKNKTYTHQAIKMLSIYSKGYVYNLQLIKIVDLLLGVSLSF